MNKLFFNKFNMVTFYFIRHGLSCSNITQGHRLHPLLGVTVMDPGLDDQGILDVKRLRSRPFIKNLKPFKGIIFVSPMSRALQTATILFKDHKHVSNRFLKISKHLHELYPITPSNRNMSRNQQNEKRSKPFTSLVYHNKTGNIIAESTVIPMEKGVYENKSGNLNTFMKKILKEYCREFQNNPNAQVVVVTHGALMIRDLKLNKKRDNLNNMVYSVTINYRPPKSECIVSKSSSLQKLFRGYTYDLKNFKPIACKRACPYHNPKQCKLRQRSGIYASYKDLTTAKW